MRGKKRARFLIFFVAFVFVNMHSDSRSIPKKTIFFNSSSCQYIQEHLHIGSRQKCYAFCISQT